MDALSHFIVYFVIAYIIACSIGVVLQSLGIIKPPKQPAIAVAQYQNLQDIANDFKDKQDKLISVSTNEIYGTNSIQSFQVYYWAGE